MNDIGLTAAWVAAAVKGDLVSGDAATQFGGVSIDSRTVMAGDLFIAIRGERFDGAAFAAAAMEKGAAGVVVPRGWKESGKHRARLSGERVVIHVDDTTLGLQALANVIRRESGTKVVAITGSAGKTTTKEVTSELLASRYRVIRNRGNLNNHIGLPLSLIDLRRRPDIAVVELGMNHAGEVSTLVRIAEPDVRVWTNVGEAHLGFFASVDAIADAKAEIFEGATRSSLLVANADDDRIAARLPKFAGGVVTFGIERDADVRATDVIDRGVEGVAAHVETSRGAADMRSPLVGRGNLSNVLAATAVALELGVPLDVVVDRTARLAAASHRGEIVRLSNGVTVVDDSYNANPPAMKQALDVLARSKADRRIAVLGEMLELGDRTAALHEEVGRAVANARIDVLVAVGGSAAGSMAAAAVSAGMPPARVQHVPTSDEAAEAVVALVTRGDVVLVKGSRGVKTDRVVERLQAQRG